MKIFIAARVPRGDERQQALGEGAARAVLRSGHTPFLAYQENLARGLGDPTAFMPFVRHELWTAGLLLLLYDPNLRGGLIEAGMAYAWGKPIWLAHAGSVPGKVSSSALGIADQIIVYQDAAGLEESLCARLEAWNPSRSGTPIAAPQEGSEP